MRADVVADGLAVVGAAEHGHQATRKDVVHRQRSIVRSGIHAAFKGGIVNRLCYGIAGIPEFLAFPKKLLNFRMETTIFLISQVARKVREVPVLVDLADVEAFSLSVGRLFRVDIEHAASAVLIEGGSFGEVQGNVWEADSVDLHWESPYAV